jgi:hypothetical protein
MKKVYREIFIVLVLLIGTAVISCAASLLIHGNWNLITHLFQQGMAILRFGMPYLSKLIVLSLRYLWPPIVVYCLIGLVTKSWWWRFFLCLVALSSCIIIFRFWFREHFSFVLLPQFLLYIMQLYLFLLWTLPREVWNFLGGIIFFTSSIVVIIFPDLPGYLDDFGVIFAIFMFIFLYVNTVASVVQRLVDSYLWDESRKALKKSLNI